MSALASGITYLAAICVWPKSTFYRNHKNKVVVLTWVLKSWSWSFSLGLSLGLARAKSQSLGLDLGLVTKVLLTALMIIKLL